MENPAPNPAAPPPASIEMVGVDATHEHAPTIAAIEDVNWRLGSGEFWAVGGFQGAGKSVLLAAAAGINRPLRGQLKLFDSNIAELDAADAFKRLLRVGLVF